MSKHSMAAAGIDTGKFKLDVALAGRKGELQVGNDAAGHARLSAWLRRHRIKRVGIEASGGYESAVVAHLRANGFVVIVFQPVQVRAYARYRLQRAKNDKIDAALIAVCAREAEEIHAAPDPRLAPFAEHLTMIEQLVDYMARLKTVREASRDQRIRQFWSITLPQIRYTIITSSTLMIVGSLTFFDIIFVLTEGGPGDATRVLALDMYKTGFQANLMGPASAIAVILVLVGLALALLLRRLGGGGTSESQLEGA